MRSVRAVVLAVFGLLSLGGMASAQTAPPKTFVEIDGHKLHVRLSGSARQLQAESATTFSKLIGAQVEFEIDAAGNVAGLVLIQNGRRLSGPRK